MESATLARNELWEIAATQHGFVTAQQALDQGISRGSVKQLVHRGTLHRAAFGVYRFPKYPYADSDRYMLAVLWTRAPEAALSHETALDVYAMSDLIPTRIHVTVGKDRRLRREDAERYEIHTADLNPGQIGWWDEIPTVTAATAVAQCIDSGTPTYLIRQALERGRAQGRLTARQHDQLSARLEARGE